MPTSTVLSVQYKRSFPSQYGDADGMQHAFIYEMEDGTTGEASHKSKPAPFNPGDVVDYSITGQFRGTNKLKVQKPQGVSVPRGTQGQQRQAPAQQQQHRGAAARPPAPASSASITPGMKLNGQTIGQNVNNAAEDMREAFRANSITAEQFASIDFAKKWIFQRASMYARICLVMESGRLHGDAAQQPPPPPPPEEPPAAEPPPPPRAVNRPQPGPDGQAWSNQPGNIDEEDVPF